MTRVFIGIGSNEGDRLEHISRGAQTLGTLAQIQLVQMATIRETTPVGGPSQAAYLNTVVELSTTLAPGDLLRTLKQIEVEAGRRPSDVRWGPRPLDLDLLFYEDRVIHEAGLEVPHPRLHERRFVLEPLAELAPDLVHPVLKRTVQDLLANALNSSIVQ